MEKGTEFSIYSEEEYDSILDWIDVQFDKEIEPDSPDGVRLKTVLLLIKD